MTTIPTLPSVQVNCVSNNSLQELIVQIQKWQEKAANQHTDLNHEKSLWTGQFYNGFLSERPASWTFSVALECIPSLAMAAPALNLKESRNLLARVKFCYEGALSRTETASLLPDGMLHGPEDESTTQLTADLKRVASDGKSAVFIRTFYWVLYKVKDAACMALNRSNEAERQAFWFAGLDRVTIVWILSFIWDALDFEWLVEAADRHDAVQGRYTITEQQQAEHVLHMLRLRLMHAADAVFLFMIDAKPNDDRTMIFPWREKNLAAAAEYWRQKIQTAFTSSELYHVPLDDWPVLHDLQYRKLRGVVTAAHQLRLANYISKHSSKLRDLVPDF